MSVDANIRTGFDASIKLLKKVELFKTQNISRKMSFGKNKFSKDFIYQSQKTDYKKIYDIALKKGDYDILLIDTSFFQFSYEKDRDNKINEIRYAYYNMPYDVDDYYIFLKKQGFDYEEVGDEFLDIYEQYIVEAQLKKQVTPIRYDYDTTICTRTVHASSHLHIGHNNDIRIPCDKVLSPQTFVSFVIRHVYFENFKSKIEDENFKKLYLNKCNIIDDDDDDILILEEKNDIYLS